MIAVVVFAIAIYGSVMWYKLDRQIELLERIADRLDADDMEDEDECT